MEIREIQFEWGGLNSGERKVLANPANTLRVKAVQYTVSS